MAGHTPAPDHGGHPGGVNHPGAAGGLIPRKDEEAKPAAVSPPASASGPHRARVAHITSSNCLAIAAPSGIGTALPICLAMAVREPMKRWLSGKPWSRAAS